MSKVKKPPTEGQQMAAFMGGYFAGLLLFVIVVGYFISQAPA